MRIGQVASEAGVGIETVRFYERRGLVPRPSRPVSGYREYPPDTVDRILFIRRAKELGFQLREIKELLSLKVRPRTSCSSVMRRAESKIADIDAKLADLKRMRRALGKLVAACERRTPTADCFADVSPITE